MVENSKPEVHLEVSSGFFRISTEKAIYNITVLPSEVSSVTQVVGKIVEAEKADKVDAPPVVELGGLSDDDYYKELSNDIYNDIGVLAKSLSTTIMDLPAEDRRGKRAELNEAGEKIANAKKQLQDIVSMTEKATMKIMDQVEKVQGQSDGIKDLLSLLKNHAAFAVSEEIEGEAENNDESRQEAASVIFSEIKEDLDQAKAVLSALQEVGETAGKEDSKPNEKKTRFLFPLDVVFQTMYELCTNETVKTHISAARKDAETLFSTDTFVDQISENVINLEADSDNFYTVPLTDIFNAFYLSCSDDKIKNLFTRMEKNKDSIFLDQSLPLEVPPTEEVEVEGAEGEEDAGTETDSDERGGDLANLLDKIFSLVNDLEALPADKASSGNIDTSLMTKNDQADILKKIEDAFDASGNICMDVTKITETLSFQDISGQQILKIIKLLSDFQVQLLGIVVSFGSQLKHKAEEDGLTLEEGKKLAQDDVDQFLNSMTSEEVGGEGALDQESVNQLLEEMGF